MNHLEPLTSLQGLLAGSSPGTCTSSTRQRSETGIMLDVGLMGAMSETPAESRLVDGSIFSEYKGAFTELYVFAQLKALGISLYCHSVDNSSIEIDFLAQKQDKVVPIEVEAEVNVKSKSLRTFISNNPELHGIRFSTLPFEEQEWMTNIPLYACMTWM